jgi:uncharacterized protein YbjT (DUF2867 family)
MSKILVVGASGTIGSELVRLLRAQGADVAAATSNPQPRAGQVHLDVVKQQGYAAALDGVDRAFVLSPPGITTQDELLGPLIELAVTKGLRKLVLMTAMGSDADPALPARKLELQLEGSGLAYNILRPNWFMQNFHTFWMGGIMARDQIELPVGRAKGSFIDTRDVAAVAADLLRRADLDNRDFDLTGAEALDHDQVAALLSEESGRTIRYTEIAPEVMRQGLLDAKLPPPYVEFLLLILGYFKQGYAERVTDSVAAILGRAPRTFAQYVKDHRAAWQR